MMIIWDSSGACPVGFLATGAIALALGSTGCSLLKGGSAAEADSSPAAEVIADAPEAVSKPLMAYKVEKGDSLWKLARDYQTSAQEIRAANKLEGDLIRAGDTILIPTNHAEPQENGEGGRGAAAGTLTSKETVPTGVTPGVGTQPIQGAPTTPPSRAETAPNGPAAGSAPPITSEELRSANIRYFSNQSESRSQ